MATALLYLFSFLALIGGIAMVVQRNPIHAAISLLFSMLNLAAIYALLQAHLIAALQIIIYAGAIVILIVYVIMLLQLGTDDDRAFRRSALWSLPIVILFSVLFSHSLFSIPGSDAAAAAALTDGEVACAPGVTGCETICGDDTDNDGDGMTDCADTDCGRFQACYGTVEAVGSQLLGPYVLPFEVSSVLLLAGIVGSVLLTGKRPKEFAAPVPPPAIDEEDPDVAQPGGKVRS